MSEAADAVAGLSPAELSRFAQRRRGKSTGLIPRRARSAREPVSSAQQRIWLAERLTPNTSQYHVPLVIEFEGAFERGLLQECLTLLVERHESLRTGFLEIDGEPFQVVRPSYAPPIEFVDLSSLAPQEREAACLDIAQANIQRTFDLEEGPLFRACLFTFGPGHNRLLVVLHHIVADGWSAGIIATELRQIWAALGDGGPPLATLPIQYPDFAVWQREALASGKFDDQLGYWKTRLAGLPPSPLPVCEPPARSERQRAGVKSFQISATTSEALVALGRQERATPFMTLLAAFKVLLFRHTGQSDVVVGAPVAGRTTPELEQLVGCFVNPLVLRTDLSGDPQFAELLQRVRETTLGAYANQDLPFERLVEELHPSRSAARSPLFQVAFSLQNLPGAGETTESGTGLILDTPKFDLFLSLTPTPKGFSGVWEYDRAILTDEDVRRLSERFLILLDGIATRPVRISGLQLLDARDIALAEDAIGIENPSIEARVDKLIARQAALHPKRIAVRAESGALSYGELWARSGDVALRVRQAGLDVNSAVGLMLDRSPDALISMVGILRAGCAYVPIDPQYPSDRIGLMLEPLAAVVTTRKAAVQHAGGFDGTIIALDEPHTETASPDHPREAAPTDAAYAIFTSGSTGRPKLAAVSHAGLSNLLSWYIREFDLNEDDRALVITSLSFDLTQKNILAPLSIGGEVQLLPPGPFDPLEVARLVRANRSTLLNCTPSALYALADLGETTIDDLASLRNVVLGGEPISTRRLLPLLRSRRFQADFANTYGPTECSDVVSCYRLPGLERHLDLRVPIGRSIPNVRLLVLDENLAHMPEGMEGELYIGGLAVGLGYCDDLALSAQKFLPDPYAESAGALLYKTGDRARRLRDGSLDFLGRRDEQVKVRGFRVEPGEIESALLRHALVRDAAVGTFAVGSDEPRLAAFIVPQLDAAGPLLKFQELARAGGLEHENLFELPNGMLIAHRNRSETEFLYRELFEEESYFRHGIVLPDKPVIFDVGANIGLFGMAVAQRRRDARIFAFEPIPPIFQTLSVNSAAYGLDMQLFRTGLSASAGSANFRHYQHASILSGRYSDAQEERDAVQSYLLAERSAGRAGDLSDSDLQDVLDQRLTSDIFECELRRLSDVIRSEGVSQVDLLKIDVEKSELDVLRGIDAEHWPRIRQIVAEVHDTGNNLAEVLAMLEAQGFEVKVEQDRSIATAGMHNVYARRPGAAQAVVEASIESKQVWVGPETLKRALRAHLAALLPEPLVPGHFVFLDGLPITPSGKVDRRALPKLALDALYRRMDYAPPRTEFEVELAQIWTSVLGLPRIGVRDDFFELGGHSLLATQVVARIRRAYDVNLPLRTFFEHPTIEGLSRAVVSAILKKEDMEAAEAVTKSETMPVPV